MTIRFMKNLCVVGALAAISVVSAVAQSTTLVVNVPFAFVVNGVKLSAGSYLVEKADETGMLMIRGQKSAIVQTISTGNYNSASELPGLSFERNAAGEPVLTKVQIAGEPSRQIMAHTPVVAKTIVAAK
jgi:hypothetical protein